MYSSIPSAHSGVLGAPLPGPSLYIPMLPGFSPQVLTQATCSTRSPGQGPHLLFLQSLSLSSSQTVFPTATLYLQTLVIVGALRCRSLNVSLAIAPPSRQHTPTVCPPYCSRSDSSKTSISTALRRWSGSLSMAPQVPPDLAPDYLSSHIPPTPSLSLSLPY